MEVLALFLGIIFYVVHIWIFSGVIKNSSKAQLQVDSQIATVKLLMLIARKHGATEDEIKQAIKTRN